mgnify:CR=1 FL=1
MTKRIFRSIFLVALVVLLLSVALLSVVFYNDYAVQYRSELKSEALSMAHAINGGLAEEDYLRSLEQDKISPIRITWIGADGTVRYDNEAAPAQMENHAARTEVADALRYGAGESERYSATLSQKTFYYACRLQDGTVLRLAGTRDSVLGILLRMLRPAVAAVLVAIALAWLLSYRLSKRIVRPLNALDLEHPEQAEAYDELSPLLEKISAQNRQIAAQMDELRRRQTEFTAITEHMNEGLLIVDARTNLLFCNPSARRLLQIENVEKQSVLAVNRSEDFREAVQRALSGEHDLRTLTLDGRIYQLMANPAMEDGRLAGAVLVLLDVTEREDREQLRREFTANVSHELRTPLTSISGFAELIRDGIAKPQDVQHFAGNIYTEAQRLIALVGDIIRLSQLDEGSVGSEKTDLRLDGMAASVVSRLQDAAAQHDVTLRTELKPCRVHGIAQIVDELIYNLCDNAIKYNRKDGSVTVSTAEENGQPVLRVADTGIGIPAAEQDRVFERFYRVDKSHSRAIGGTGLGLSIVKHAAAYHHARVAHSPIQRTGDIARLVALRKDTSAAFDLRRRSEHIEQPCHIFMRKLTRRRVQKARITRNLLKEILDIRNIGHVAASLARDIDFLAQLLVFFQQRDARARPCGLKRRHHSCRAAADYGNITRGLFRHRPCIHPKFLPSSGNAR